jgi:hypothetical protein
LAGLINVLAATAAGALQKECQFIQSPY